MAQKYGDLIKDKLDVKCELIDKNRLEIWIINDFTMFEYDSKTKKYEFFYNRLSLHKGEIKAFDNKNIEKNLANHNVFVCNSNEIASYTIRNHDLKSLAKDFFNCYLIYQWSKKKFVPKSKDVFKYEDLPKI